MASNYICEVVARGAHKIIREAAKIPYMMEDEKDVATQNGAYFNQLEGDLSEETYKALCAHDADVVLETIYYCQTELLSVRTSRSLQATRRVLNPNFDHNEEVRPAPTVGATYI